MVITNNKENGKNIGDTLLQPEKLTVKPNEYYTHPKLLEDFEDFKTVVQNSQAFGSEMGARNYIFTGPPGTGKTLAAQVMAVELQVPFYDITSFVKGQSMAVPQVFNELRTAAEKNQKQNGKGIIAFIDEIEGLASRDNIVDPMQYQSMTQVLSQLDGVGSNDGIFIIGTTNRQNDLDEAIRSRFGEEIEFLPPDTHGRYEILKIHANGKGGHKFIVPDNLLHEVSEKSYGYVGRDIKSLLNKAFVHAQKRKTTDVTMEDLDYGLRKVKPSAIKDMPFVEPHVKLTDIVGYNDHKAMLRSIVERSHESVMLLYGPKGTGKTYAAEALAGEFGYNYILVKGSELENMFVGKTKDNTEKIIKRAKQLSPCIVCFDEISSFVERKGTMSHKDSQTGYLQSVLSRPPEGVYIIGTDNNPEFLRGPFMDRFIHKLFFGMPSKEEQLALWKVYAPSIDATQLVKANDQLSCRDIANAAKRINDYGIAQTVEAYKRIVEHIPKNGQDTYKDIITNIGDGVADYRALKEFSEVKS
jgi:SpoVK/Ycf46/Vps4 family AAA+-type ATPase